MSSGHYCPHGESWDDCAPCRQLSRQWDTERAEKQRKQDALSDAAPALLECLEEAMAAYKNENHGQGSEQNDPMYRKWAIVVMRAKGES